MASWGFKPGALPGHSFQQPCPKIGHHPFAQYSVSLLCHHSHFQQFSTDAVLLSSADNSRNAVPAEDRTCSNPTIILKLFRCCFRNYSPQAWAVVTPWVSSPPSKTRSNLGRLSGITGHVTGCWLSQHHKTGQG